MKLSRSLSLEELIACVLKYHPKEKFDVIEKAWRHAEKLHEGQTRKSGEAYIIHPIAVASTLAELMMDSATVAAGLLHDVLEDCPECTVETLQKEYGAEVAQLVDGVTKLTKLDSSKEEQRVVSKAERHAESLRKMILAMAKDIRVVIIKLADRLHNMRTMKFQPPDRQIAISRETLDIYAPLAHRLGVYSIKSELEDLAFSFLEPEKYEELKIMVGMKRQEREAGLRGVMSHLSEELDKMGITHEVGGRPKHFYSIYRKMEKQNIPFDQIFDLIAVRVIVENVHDCYSVLGLVHTLWKQVPNRFKDYISTPKANQYQSIHTTVVGQGGNAFEIQIRTRDMHRQAEYGIAAHWRYKEGKQSGGDMDRKLEWLRQFLDWSTDESTGVQEFIDELKGDLFAEEVFVFTPKGDVINLPRGATPLDFAYRIHSGVGNKCIGAKANGRIITLDSELSTGDFVEIMTSNAAKGPSQDWMKIVKTPQARAKIRQFFKKELKAENIELGRSMLEREAQRNAAQLSAYLKPELIDPILKKHGFLDLDDIYSSIGYGAMRASSIFSRLVAEQKRLERSLPAPPPPEINIEEENQRRQKLASSHGIYVEGEPGMLVRYAKCCNPVPGDDIVGYTTRGRGVTIHKSDCINALNSELERIIDVSWDASAESIYTASIRILARDKKGLLADVSELISSMKAPIEQVTAKVNKDGTCIITLTVQTQSKAQLDELIKTIRKQPEVINVFRTT